jgi:hypothetical protein
MSLRAEKLPDPRLERVHRGFQGQSRWNSIARVTLVTLGPVAGH